MGATVQQLVQQVKWKPCRSDLVFEEALKESAYHVEHLSLNTGGGRGRCAVHAVIEGHVCVGGRTA